MNEGFRGRDSARRREPIPSPAGGGSDAAQGEGPDNLSNLWHASPVCPVDAAAALDRATRRRRALPRGPHWARARLEEGLARLLMARDVAEWGHRSYAIQAVEAAMDALRDAIAYLPPDHIPSPEQVAALRRAVVERWADIAHDPMLHRLADLWPGSLASMRKDISDDPPETD